MSITIRDLQAWKAEGRRFAMLTAYDYPTAKIFDEAGIPVLLVGDSVGNTILGYENTLPVTMEEMLHHTRAVARGVTNALVVGDMPSLLVPGERRGGRPQRRPVPEGGGAGAVKIEGAQVELGAHACRSRDPGDGARGPHAAVGTRDGRLPRPGPGRGGGAGDRSGARAREGGRVRDRPGGDAVRSSAPSSPTTLQIPTIGIGAGPGTDAQVLVSPTCSGCPNASRSSRAPTSTCAARSAKAATEFAADVAAGTFPDEDHSYT